MYTPSTECTMCKYIHCIRCIRSIQFCFVSVVQSSSSAVCAHKECEDGSNTLWPNALQHAYSKVYVVYLCTLCYECIVVLNLQCIYNRYASYRYWSVDTSVCAHKECEDGSNNLWPNALQQASSKVYVVYPCMLCYECVFVVNMQCIYTRYASYRYGSVDTSYIYNTHCKYSVNVQHNYSYSLIMKQLYILIANLVYRR